MKSHLIFILVAGMLLVGTVSATVETYWSSGNGDGGLWRENANETYAAIRVGAGTTASLTGATKACYIVAKTTSPNFGEMDRVYLQFNTSDIPDDAIIDSAILGVSANTKSNNLGSPTYGITRFRPTTNGTTVKGDYNRTDDEYLSDTQIAYSSLSSSYNNFSLNSLGLSNVSKTAYSNYMVRDSWDVSGVFGGSWSSGASTYVNFNMSEQTGTTRDPFLEVTYHIPDTTPPGTIQGLTNDTTACEQITWDFQGPGDADWNGTQIYRDGVYQYTLDNATYQDVWSGLTGGQTYEFASHTFDITGNVDPDWVNQSATPTTCTVAPVADFTADNTSICLGDTIQFNDTSENSPASWAWDFGDDNVSAVQNATHTYGYTGLFTVILSAANSEGSDAETKTDYITVADCNVNAAIEANATCYTGLPLPVSFSGYCPTAGNYWDFGDGNSSVDPVTNHTYEYYGMFRVNHTCTVNEVNTTDWTDIAIGPPGTLCPGDAGGTTTVIGGSGMDQSPYLIIGSTIGLLFGLILIRRNEL